MDFLLHLLVCSILVWTAHAQLLLPPEEEGFWFDWQPYNSTLTRCGTINLEIFECASFKSVGPYTVLLYRAGQAPYRFTIGSGTSYLWTVDLNLGGPYLLSMQDANNSTGGISAPFYVEAGSLSCPQSNETTPTLPVSVTSSPTSCDTISFHVSEGTPPYKLTVAPIESQPKAVLYTKNEFDYKLDLSAGMQVAFIVQDSTGRGSTSEIFNVTEGSSGACLIAASTTAQASSTSLSSTTSSPLPDTTTSAQQDATVFSPSSTTSHPSVISGSPQPSSADQSPGSSTVSAIVGGIIGGLAGVILLLVIFWHVRKRKRTAERYRGNRTFDGSPPITRQTYRPRTVVDHSMVFNPPSGRDTPYSDASDFSPKGPSRPLDPRPLPPSASGYWR